MKPATARNTQLLEVLVWSLLALLCAGSVCLYRPQPLYNDSYQYLNVAENLSHGRGLATSLVHFDTERSHGRIPAPLTSFPPGYPAVVALTSGLAGDFEGAARAVSVVSYVGTAALLAWALMLAGVPAFLRRVSLLLFATNAVALNFATAVLSESAYTLLSTGALVALIRVEKVPRPGRVEVARVLAAHTLAGLACLVRYAGLFLIGGMIGYALLQLILRRSRTRAAFLLTAVIPVTLAGAMLLRNLFSVGTWKGGSDLPVHNPLKVVTAEYVRAQLHLFLGQRPLTFGVWEGILLAAVLGVAAALLASLREGGVPHAGGRRAGGGRRPAGATLLVVLYVLTYSAAMFYAGLSTVISFGTRMFLPLLPLYLLLLGVCLNRLTARGPAGAPRAWLKAGLLSVAVLYAGINARDLSEPLPPARHELLATWYAEPAAGGRPLLEWVESKIPAGGVIVAAEGQATGYLLRRPTLSLIDARPSRVRWECDEVKKQMKRFGASFVILYRPTPAADSDPLLAESEFVAASVSRQPPCGFVVAAENPHVRILEIGGATP